MKNAYFKCNFLFMTLILSVTTYVNLFNYKGDNWAGQAVLQVVISIVIMLLFIPFCKELYKIVKEED